MFYIMFWKDESVIIQTMVFLIIFIVFITTINGHGTNENIAFCEKQLTFFKTEVCLAKNTTFKALYTPVVKKHENSCDILRKIKHWRQYKRNLETFEKIKLVNPPFPRLTYQTTWEPTFFCNLAERIGMDGDGGKWVCDIEEIKRPSCLVYSIGSNKDASFESGIAQRITGCEIHTFDHTIGPWFERPVIRNWTFHFYGVGIGKKLKTLLKVVKLLGHENRTIDILKIDCENCEWDLFYPLLNECGSSSILQRIKQLNIELHGQPPYNLIQKFAECGFALFYKEANIVGCAGDCVEISLIQVNFQSLHEDDTLKSFFCI